MVGGFEVPLLPRDVTNSIAMMYMFQDMGIVASGILFGCIGIVFVAHMGCGLMFVRYLVCLWMPLWVLRFFGLFWQQGGCFGCQVCMDWWWWGRYWCSGCWGFILLVICCWDWFCG